MKEHLAWWRGFNVMKELVFNTLKNYEFDFSRCTNTNQICNQVKEAITTELKKLNRGD